MFRISWDWSAILTVFLAATESKAWDGGYVTVECLASRREEGSALLISLAKGSSPRSTGRWHGSIIGGLRQIYRNAYAVTNRHNRNQERELRECSAHV
jgi:hypothetical protein